MERPDVPSPAPGGPEVDLDVARQLFEGDEATLRFVAAVFVDEARGQLEGVRRALDAGEPRKLADAAHRLKGSVALFGARRATELAERLQRAGSKDGLEGAAGLVEELERRVGRILVELEELLRSAVPAEAGGEERAARAGRR